jgi:PEP-CTERM motif
MNRYRIMVATVVAGTLLALANGASAVPVVLSLTGPIDGNTVGPQSSSNPCVIAGTACSQPAGFGFNNFAQTGNDPDYNAFSTSVDGGNNGTFVADGVQGTPYTVAQLDAITNDQPFVIAIDVNTAQHEETLQLFEVIVNGAVEFVFNGPASIDPLNNGNGFGDYTLGVIDLGAFAETDTVLFHVIFDGASDGAESFFIVGSSPTAVPEPATLLLFGSAMTGLGIWGRKRARSSQA